MDDLKNNPEYLKFVEKLKNMYPDIDSSNDIKCTHCGKGGLSFSLNRHGGPVWGNFCSQGCAMMSACENGYLNKYHKSI